ncbi:hypothetical protein SAMN02745724_00110 [Pseudoalteromonas denitrificans DSM 6059]|uniref:Uncharacterized protein n=1 Tax=Pseudoalteromonas denitrificans DSM 6059 TaxID=1123010 RepID=A0A1I1DXP2_9GAMM|nr:hypothetical protein SAMN02745724_00110 [Pseudoalteromonas denitrificans DSM 6059]
MTIIIVFFYIALCFYAGFAGRNSTIGPIGYFLLAFLLSPVLVLIFLVICQIGSTKNCSRNLEQNNRTIDN